jgi:hypothetical protein
MNNAMIADITDSLDPEEAAPPHKRKPLTIRSVGEIRGMQIPESDLILGNGYLERGEPAAICGMGGIGKSRLTMQLAMMHRAGRPFLGWSTHFQNLRWLFLQTENGNRRLKSDIERMLAAFDPAEQARIESGVFYHTLETDDDGIFFVNDAENIARIYQAIDQCQPDIVVLDPLRDATTDDINKDMAMNNALGLMWRAVKRGDPRRTLVVVHHAGEGKAGIAKAVGFDRGAFGRNSKVLKTWTRSQMNIAPANPEDNAQIVIASGKCNNHEEFPAISARLNPETMLYELVEGWDEGAWRDALSAEVPDRSTAAVVEIVREAGGGLEKNEVHARLRSKGIGKDSAWKMIKAAVAEGTVEESTIARPKKKSAVYLTMAG